MQNTHDPSLIPHAQEEEEVETTPIIPSSPRSLLKTDFPFLKQPSSHPRSLLKTSNTQPKFIQTLSVDRSLLKSNNQSFLKKLNRKLISAQKRVLEECMPTPPSKKSPPKFKQKVKLKMENSTSDNSFRNKLKLKKSTKHRTRKVSSSSSRSKKSGIVYDENITINHTEPVNSITETDHSSTVLVTNNEDSDIEIDIESGEPDLILPSMSVISDNKSNHENTIRSSQDIDNNIDHIKSTESVENHSSHESSEFISNLLANCSDEVKKILTDLVEPSEELKLNATEASDLEKLVHFEFFQGRQTKTPDRYMKIRGHILNSWFTSKPSYVSKTAVRTGLKNCGDVNCISRIHSLLEQMGAINFGCQGGEYIDM